VRHLWRIFMVWLWRFRELFWGFGHGNFWGFFGVKI
jgi:hypothetical protein